MSYSKIAVIGNLGKDATVNQLQSGKQVINFSLAHTEKWNDAQGQPQQKTNWFDCSQFTDKLGIVPYLLKGAQVYVEGVPELRTYTSADGKAGASITIKVIVIQLLGGAPQQQQQAPQQQYQQPQQPGQPVYQQPQQPQYQQPIQQPQQYQQPVQQHPVYQQPQQPQYQQPPAPAPQPIQQQPAAPQQVTYAQAVAPQAPAPAAGNGVAPGTPVDDLPF